MNFGSISLVCDFLSRQVTPAEGTPALLIPTSGDLIVAVNFTSLNDSGANAAISPTLTDLSLAIKEVDSSEILVTSDAWSLVSGQFLLHLSLSGTKLAAAIADNGSANLIGELLWTMANPYTSLFGPSSLTVRSADFALPYSTI